MAMRAYLEGRELEVGGAGGVEVTGRVELESVRPEGFKAAHSVGNEHDPRVLLHPARPTNAKDRDRSATRGCIT